MNLRQKNATAYPNGNGDQSGDDGDDKGADDGVGDSAPFKSWWGRKLREQNHTQFAAAFDQHVTQH